MKTVTQITSPISKNEHMMKLESEILVSVRVSGVLFIMSWICQVDGLIFVRSCTNRDWWTTRDISARCTFISVPLIHLHCHWCINYVFSRFTTNQLCINDSPPQFIIYSIDSFFITRHSRLILNVHNSLSLSFSLFLSVCVHIMSLSVHFKAY